MSPCLQKSDKAADAITHAKELQKHARCCFGKALEDLIELANLEHELAMDKQFQKKLDDEEIIVPDALRNQFFHILLALDLGE